MTLVVYLFLKMSYNKNCSEDDFTEFEFVLEWYVVGGKNKQRKLTRKTAYIRDKFTCRLHPFQKKKVKNQLLNFVRHSKDGDILELEIAQNVHVSLSYAEVDRFISLIKSLDIE